MNEYEKIVNEEMKRYEVVIEKAFQQLLTTGEVILKYNDLTGEIIVFNPFKNNGWDEES